MADTDCKALCELCCAVFARRSSLVRHIKNVHFPKRAFICEHCSKSYITKSNLLRHITSTHSNIKNKQCPLMWQCPLCIFESDKETMVEHYQIVHNVVTAYTDMSFKSFDEFQRWKQDIESETSSKYIRYRIKKCLNKVKYYYRCHRDGLYKGRGNSIRRLKKIGSNKINGHCPAKMDVCVNEITELVSIKYINSHVGHKMESFRLSISKSDKSIKKGAKEYVQENKDDCIKSDMHTEQIKTNITLLNNDIPSIKEALENKNNFQSEEIKNTLIDQFQLIVQKIYCPEQFNIVQKHLTVLKSVLDNFNK